MSSLNIGNLLEYWLDAEWWELPPYDSNEYSPFSKCIPVQSFEKTEYLRVCFGCHSSNYHFTNNGRHFQKAKQSAFIISLVIKLTHDPDTHEQIYLLDEDKRVCNRALLMYLCLDKYGKPVRRDAAQEVEEALYSCAKICFANSQREALSLQEFLDRLNQSLIELLLSEQLQIIKLCHDNQKLNYRWRLVSTHDMGDQFGPFFESDLLKIKQKPLLDVVQGYISRTPRKTPDFLKGYQEDRNKFSGYLSAENMPLGYWPSNPDYGLVYLQYLALQAARDKHPIIAVNGPPGTGKTKLLKDFIADCFVQRTIAITNSLTGGEDQTDITNAKVPTELILRHSMVVASSNNTAIENISKEIPILSDEVQTFYPQLAYFRKLTVSLGLQHDTWGLFSAVLGKSRNRRLFTNSIFDADTHYYPGPLGALVTHLFQINDPGRLKKFFEAAQRQRLKPTIAYLKKEIELIQLYQLESKFCSEWRGYFCEEKFEPDLESALQQCNISEIQNFLLTLNALKFNKLKSIIEQRYKQERIDRRSQRKVSLTDEIKQFRILTNQYQFLMQQAKLLEEKDIELNNTKKEFDIVEKSLSQLKIETEFLQQEMALEARATYTLQETIRFKQAQHKRQEQNLPYAAWWRKLLGSVTLEYKQARQGLSELNSEIFQLENKLLTLRQVQNKKTAQLETIRHDINNIGVQQQKLQRLIQYQFKQVDELSDSLELHCEKHLFSNQSWQKAKPILHNSAPWGSPLLNRVRGELFQQALKVNEAYIEYLGTSCAVKLVEWSNLIHSKSQDNTNRSDITENERLEAWAWFFLCFPVMSTTFHSVASQFSSVAQTAPLGYALIDEAGQSLPYYALGLLSRVRQAIVVGDPLQLEPVCTLPHDIDVNLASDRECCADEKNLQNYLVTTQSAQSFADAASPIQSTIGKMKVGIPLTVHRRCDNPMFDYCNSIAYDQTMVHGKPHRPSNYSPAFPSSWVECSGNISNYGLGYINQSEIDCVIELIKCLIKVESQNQDLLEADPIFPIFVITPFRAMANKLSAVLKKHIELSNRYELNHISCNTVHSFQGQQAPTVIMSLVCDQTKEGGVNWVNEKCNLMNVAVSRAKRRLFIVGDPAVWSKQQYTGQLLKLLPRCKSVAEIFQDEEVEHSDYIETAPVVVDNLETAPIIMIEPAGSQATSMDLTVALTKTQAHKTKLTASLLLAISVVGVLVFFNRQYFSIPASTSHHSITQKVNQLPLPTSIKKLHHVRHRYVKSKYKIGDCEPYTRSIMEGGRKLVLHGVACLEADHHWHLKS